MTNKIISEPATGINRAFTVHFSKPEAADRGEIEQFIGDIFHQAYGAKIKHFMPYLMNLRDLDGKLIAACGLRSAATERLFVENYMDQPVEVLLSERIGSIVQRSDIVEIGNFSVAEPGMARQLITAIFDQLYATSKQWVVFTTVQVLHNALIKKNITPEILCDADKEHLPLEDQSDWGSYYEQKPQVMAIRRSKTIA